MLDSARAFHEQVEPFVHWLELTEKRVSALDNIGADVARIEQQIDAQKSLSVAIATHKDDLDELIVKGQDVFERSTGDDKQAIQQRVDKLKQSYTDLDRKCNLRLAKMEEALPLAANFREIREKLAELLQQMHMSSSCLIGASPTAPTEP